MFNRQRFKDGGYTNATQKHQFLQETGRRFQLKTGRKTLLIVLVLMFVEESDAILNGRSDSKLELISCKILEPLSSFAHFYGNETSSCIIEDFQDDFNARITKNYTSILLYDYRVHRGLFLLVEFPEDCPVDQFLQETGRRFQFKTGRKTLLIVLVLMLVEESDAILNRRNDSKLELISCKILEPWSSFAHFYGNETSSCIIEVFQYDFNARITKNYTSILLYDYRVHRGVFLWVEFPEDCPVEVQVYENFKYENDRRTPLQTNKNWSFMFAHWLEVEMPIVVLGFVILSLVAGIVGSVVILQKRKKDQQKEVSIETDSKCKSILVIILLLITCLIILSDWFRRISLRNSGRQELNNGYIKDIIYAVAVPSQMITCIVVFGLNKPFSSSNFTTIKLTSSRRNQDNIGSLQTQASYIGFSAASQNETGIHLKQVFLHRRKYETSFVDFSKSSSFKDDNEVHEPLNGVQNSTDIDWKGESSSISEKAVYEIREEMVNGSDDYEESRYGNVFMVIQRCIYCIYDLIFSRSNDRSSKQGSNFLGSFSLTLCFVVYLFVTEVNIGGGFIWQKEIVFKLAICEKGQQDRNVENTVRYSPTSTDYSSDKITLDEIQMEQLDPIKEEFDTGQTPHEVDVHEEMNIVSLRIKQSVSYEIVQFLIEFCNLRKQNNMQNARHFFFQEIENIIETINDLKEIELSGEEVTDSLHRDSQEDDKSSFEGLPAATACRCLLKNNTIAVERKRPFFPQMSLERHPYVATVIPKTSEITDIISGQQKDRLSNEHTDCQLHLTFERRSAIKDIQVKLNNHGSYQTSYSAAKSSGQQYKDLKYKVATTMSYKKENEDDRYYLKRNKYVDNLLPSPFDETGEIIRRLTEIPQPQIDIKYARRIIEVFFVFEPLMNIVDQIAVGRPPAPHVSMRYELLRFCTLRSYPKEDKPYLIKFAAAGFYYASDGDGVVCYCCGIRRHNWTADDQPMKIHKRINPTCKFLVKNEEVNVRNNYNGPFSKSLMFIDSIPEPEESQEPTEDVNNDWAPERTRSPAPKSQNNESTGSSNQLGINTAVPKHSQYATKTSRLASFNGWPDTASHTPDVLADAGFFYAGFGDCVRCFYCGIGLRHWTQDDNPWIEHARWAKNCVFVKQKKGEEFVNLVQLAVQYSQDNATEENNGGNQLSPQEIENVLLSDAAQSVLDMGYQPRIIKKAIEQIIRQNRQAKITAQFLMEKILEIEEGSNETPGTLVSPGAATSTVGATGTTEGATGSSLNESLKKSAEPEKKHKGGKPEDKKSSNTKEKNDKEKIITKANVDVSKEKSSFDPTSQQDPKAIKAENEQLKEQTICKICLDQTVSIVFLPCGHLVTCADCAPAMRKCPICRALVKGTVRTYMS